MAKIAQVAAKYIIHAKINIDGVVDRPDVIGAIFGQTEGLLGADLELRELQKSGRIGRIEVNVDTKSGKTNGEIVIPSSLDKAETSIVAAAVEIIQRIGPCNAKIQVSNIEDIRISKREAVINRAKELLRDLMYNSMPDSQELSEEVSQSVRVMEIVEFGREKLSAGPGIAESDEVILVEGRADVLTLLKHGFKNAIALNGTSVPQTIIDLSKEKTMTVFVDGDRGGMLIVQELLSSAELDYVCRAPDGKEVEELAKKEIHKALRSRITAEQARLDISSGAFNTDVASVKKSYQQKEILNNRDQRDNRDRRSQPTTQTRPQPSYQKPQEVQKPSKPTPAESKKFSEMLEDLIGTRGAYILNDKLNILGKVPVTELQSTIKSLATGIYAIVFDGAIDKDLVSASERASVKFLVGMEAKAKINSSVALLTLNDL
ncbi:DNA primase [Candidatus Woesearchaeota archaeon]|nr:DNA primase [Candidatus Woesearchaeota archaeon]